MKLNDNDTCDCSRVEQKVYMYFAMILCEFVHTLNKYCMQKFSAIRKTLHANNWVHLFRATERI